MDLKRSLPQEPRITKRRKTDQDPDSLSDEDVAFQAEEERFQEKIRAIERNMELIKSGNHPLYIAQLNQHTRKRDDQLNVTTQWAAFERERTEAHMGLLRKLYQDDVIQEQKMNKEGLTKRITQEMHRQDVHHPADTDQNGKKKTPIKKVNQYVPPDFLEATAITEWHLTARLTEKEMKEDFTAIQKALKVPAK